MKKATFLCLLLCFMLGSSFAQQVRVTGRVTDSGTGLPVEAASINEKGKANGAITAKDGSFAFTAATGSKLMVTSIGYKPLEVLATASLGDIAITKDATNLSDVIVVGYSSQKRGNITSAVKEIKGTELIKRPVASASMTLQGLAPGVVVQQGSGQPGADGGSITIRGVGSITGSSAP